MEKYRIYRIIQDVILTSKRTLVITSLVVLSAGLFTLLNPNATFADHQEAIDEQCADQGEDSAACEQAILDEERAFCGKYDSSLGAVRTACFEHLNPGSTTSDSTVTVGGSDLECGDGGVQLGVGVGGDGKDCVGEGDDNNPIFEYLGGIVSFLSVGVGVVVTAMVMVGGIQYAAAGGTPQAVEAAKSRITNAIIALVLYVFMVGILNFLVPGGVL